jgi:hypothetical protein
MDRPCIIFMTFSDRCKLSCESEWKMKLTESRNIPGYWRQCLHDWKRKMVLRFDNVDIRREKLRAGSVASGCYVTSSRIDVTALAEMQLYVTFLRPSLRSLHRRVSNATPQDVPPCLSGVGVKIFVSYFETGRDMFRSLHWSQSVGVFARRPWTPIGLWDI